MAEARVRQPQMGLTFDDVWAAMMETDKKFQETDRKFQESKAEHDRMFAETDKKFQKTERFIKELSKNIGGVNNSLGDMAEGLMASDLYETFAALGLDFEHSFQNYEVKDKKTKRTVAEVDKLLVNGTIAMVVETKTTMTRGDVDEHETRMERLRREPNSLFANRKLYGAMASVKTSRMARQYAIDKGFFVIELAGNTIKIDMPEGFKPKTW
jgi:TPP-dependent indolepyruvate ferredoxin oxidoreductase alpha subunit